MEEKKIYFLEAKSNKIIEIPYSSNKKNTSESFATKQTFHLALQNKHMHNYWPIK